MRQKASRARLTSSVLRTVRTIKSHGWECAFLERLLHIRGRELGALKTSTLLFSVSLVSFQVSTFLVTSFWSHCRCQRVGRGHAWGRELVPAALHLMDCKDTSVGSAHWKGAEGSVPPLCFNRWRWSCLLSTPWWQRTMPWMQRRRL